MPIFTGKRPRMWVQPTHESFWIFFLKSDSQGIWTKFLCHKIQHHSLNQKPYLSKKISTGEKVRSSEFTLNMSHWTNSLQTPSFIESNLSYCYAECTHTIVTVISSNKTIVKLLISVLNHIRTISDISYQGLSGLSSINYRTYGRQMGIIPICTFSLTKWK